ncbi:Transcriptional repressor like [Actinidia chinensis var. chinensis]|uniref:Transcriptional repressor like n=1 Tax=Actinidia chinensis var. chinensis TaxID=1590841 RepID=A0A2R6P3T2_ACTCC|nr:Transcriptional repressor like [Actinidia chinensis var. chinensis]
MSRRAKNFRRHADGDDGDEGTNGTVTVPSSISTTRTKSASKPTVATSATVKKPPKKLLSFADDEETDSSPISRPSVKSSSSSSRCTKPSLSSSSHKLSSSKDRLKLSLSSSSSSSSSLPSNVQPQAGTYTKEALLELQKNTKTLAASRPLPPPPPSSEPVIVLKGLVKPSINSEPNEIDELEEEGGIGKSGSLYRREKEDAIAKFGSIGLGKSIPDQATINAIRAKRERLRQSRAAAADYISLDGGSNHGEAEGLSDEEPEFQGRIGFFGEKVEGGKKGVFEDVDERVMDGGFGKDSEVVIAYDEEDEEDKIWEEEQFRKGLGKRMDEAASRVVSSSVPVVQSVPQQKYSYPTGVDSYASVPSVADPPSIGGAVGGLGLEVMSIPQQAEISKKALLENLTRLKESHGRTMASLTRTDENLSASLLNVTALEKSLSAAGEKFIFMQKLRDFVSVICDFLQHKAPFIEELEEQMQKLHEERAAAVTERRTTDNEDEMIEVEAGVNAAISVFGKGGGSAVVIEMATNAAKAASAATKEQRNLPVKLDEFGRDMNLQNRMDMTRRADARRRRKAQSDAKRLSSMETDCPYQQIEGESSTDESDSETAAYQSNRDLLLQTAEQIFSDAAEEYSQLSVVIQRFERWKKNYSSSYRDAYMSLSAPAIFSPYVRLELLKWDPLHEDIDFINMNWHSLLYNYGIEDENNISPDDADADADLIPQLVEKVAVPILHHEIAHCWDMLSTRETRNAVSATDLVVRYVPASSQAFVELVAVLHDRLADAIANLVVPTWSPLVLKAVPNAARVAAYRFGMAVRLMRNICLWNKIIALPVLEKLALDDLLSGKVLPHLRSVQSNVYDAVTRIERVVTSLMGVWAGPSVAGQCSPKLQPLVDYLLTLAKTLEKKHGSYLGESETGGLARRLKKMLVELNEYDKARALSRTFNLKEAL